jgi:hypothetical protein
MTSIIKVCRPRYLPRERWAEAAANALRVRPDNVPEGTDLDELALPERGRLAVNIGKYWGKSGVHLTVKFLDNPSTELRRRLLSHMNAWNKTANVTFVESNTDPQVRVTRMTQETAPEGMDGYWSYVGTDILSIPKDEPTMNLDGFTMSTPDSEFIRVLRHEAGHSLGFEHEHMRLELIKRLDRKKVLAHFMATQGWTEQDVMNQVLTPLEEGSLLGTPQPDPHSIMCYHVEASLTLDGKAIAGGEDIVKSDYDFVAQLYPKS